MGEGRIALVGGLLACFDQVQETGRPSWVSMEAPSGWGKTRIAQEFYSVLAAERQPDPRYWPASILASYPAEGLADVGSRRKRVFPQVEHVPGSLPAFAWWGIAASVRNGVPSLALTEDVLQLDAHAPYLDDAWARLARWTQRHPGWWRDPLQQVATELFGFGVGMLVPVPGTGLIVPAIQALRDRRKEASERAERLESTNAITQRPTDIVDATVSMITRTAQPGLPFVVFVEDAHLADPLLAGVLVGLIDSEAAVLIITTAWQGYLSVATPVGGALAARAGRVIRITPEAGVLPDPFPTQASLRALGESERAGIVLAYYPQVEASTLQGLVARYLSPLALELLCSLPRYRERFPAGDLRLSARELASLPGSLRDLYRALWLTLPQETRRALTYASLSVPASLSPGTASDVRWHDGLLRVALAEVLPTSAAPVIAALDEESAHRGWARFVTGALRQFHEAIQLQTAREDEDLLWDSDRESFLQALATQLAAELDRDVERAGTVGPGELGRTHRAHLALALRDADMLSDGPYATAVASLLIDLCREPRELARRIGIAETWDSRGRPGSPALAERILAYWAMALQELGSVAEALPVAEDLVVLAGDFPPTDHRRFRGPRILATCMALAGKPSRAMEQIDEAIRVAASHGTHDSVQMLKLRFSRGVLLADLSPTAALVEELRSLEEDAARVLGDGSWNALAAALLRGRVAVVAGAPDGVRLLESALSRATVAWGADDTDVLVSRLSLVDALMAHDPERGRTLSRALVEDATALSGGRSPLALHARASAAIFEWTLGDSDEEAEAKRRIDEVLADATREFGPDSMLTLGIRYKRVFTRLADAGGAVEFAALIHDLEATIDDPQHMMIRTARLYLAALEKVGQSDVMNLLQTVTESSRQGEVPGLIESTLGHTRLVAEGSAEDIRDALHNTTAEQGHLVHQALELRERLGDVLEEAEDYEAALREHRALLFDRLRALGLRAGATQQSIADTARQLLALDRPRQAARLYGLAAAAAADGTRGEEWELLMAHRAAWCWFEAGHSGEAARQAEAVAERCTRVYGGTHPRTVENRLLHVRALVADGRFADALAILPASLPDADACGDEWLRSRMRRRYAIALTAADRLAEAVAHLETAAQLDPKDRRTWELLGCLRHRLGHLAEASEAYRQASDLPDPGPDSEDGRPDVAFLDRALAAAAAGLSWDEELAALAAGRKVRPDEEAPPAIGLWREQLDAIQGGGDRIERLRELAAEMIATVAPQLAPSPHTESRHGRQALRLFLTVLRDLAIAEVAEGRDLEAAMTLRLEFELRHELLGADAEHTARPAAWSAIRFSRAGKPTEAFAQARVADSLLADIATGSEELASLRDSVLTVLVDSARAVGEDDDAVEASGRRWTLAIAVWGVGSEQARWAALQRGYVMEAQERWTEALETTDAELQHADPPPADRAAVALAELRDRIRARFAEDD